MKRTHATLTVKISNPVRMTLALLAAFVLLTLLGSFKVVAQEGGCDNPPTQSTYVETWPNIYLTNITISPAPLRGTVDYPYGYDWYYDPSYRGESVACVGGTISFSVSPLTIPGTNITQTYDGCTSALLGTSTSLNYLYNITNGWTYWDGNHYYYTNALGNSLSLSFTNATSGNSWCYNVSGKCDDPPYGPYTSSFTYDQGWCAYDFVAVTGLSPNFYTGYDYNGWCATDISPTNAPGTVWVVSTNCGDPSFTNIIVTAYPYPSWLGDSNLPAGWNMTGGTPIKTNSDGSTNRTQVSVDIRSYGTKVVTANSGISHATNTFIVTAPVKLNIQGYTEANKYNPGAVVFVNNGDANNNGIPDMEEGDVAIPGPNALVPLTFTKASPALGTTNTLTVYGDYWGGNVKIWLSPQRGPNAPVIDTANGTNTYTFLDTTMPTLYIEGTSASYSSNDVQLSVTSDMTPCCSDLARITVCYMQVGADVYHTQQITFDSLDPIYFWINDVAVSGDIIKDGTDVPGLGANGKSAQVNGTSDIVNFFPVALNFGSALTLLPTNAGYQYKLVGSNVSIVYTTLRLNNAFDYLTNAANASGYGSSLTSSAYAADTVAVNGSTVLSPLFLAEAQANGGVGVVLMEAGAAATTPLKLEVWLNSARVGGCGQLNLSIAGVEQMYRQVNLRNGYTSVPGVPPNYPDFLCNGKHIIKLAGFNISASLARGYNADMFKNLFQSGSRAMFTGVDWHDDPKRFGIIPYDYYDAVRNAFLTASNFNLAVAALPGQHKYVVAHSLGNIVASSAIVDYGMTLDDYWVISAAVPSEAYSGTWNDMGMVKNQHEYGFQGWTNYESNNTNLWPQNWCNLFANTDGRYYLSWVSRFGSIANSHNYYSSGDEVLAVITNAGVPPPLLHHAFAWVNQEMRKGTGLGWVSSSLSQAGWNISRFYCTSVQNGKWSYWQADSPLQAAAISPSSLMIHPFFKPFNDEALFGTTGSDEAFKIEVRAAVLAGGLPAVSDGTGAIAVRGLRNPEDMMSTFETPNVYPAPYKKNANYNGTGFWRWLHGSFHEVAYPFDYQLYNSIAAELK